MQKAYHHRVALKLSCLCSPAFRAAKGLQVKKMLNHNLFRPFILEDSVVICVQTLVTFGSIFPCKGDGVVRQT